MKIKRYYSILSYPNIFFKIINHLTRVNLYKLEIQSLLILYYTDYYRILCFSNIYYRAIITQYDNKGTKYIYFRFIVVFI